MNWSHVLAVYYTGAIVFMLWMGIRYAFFKSEKRARINGMFEHWLGKSSATTLIIYCLIMSLLWPISLAILATDKKDSHA